MKKITGFLYVVSSWLPVAIGLTVIAMESTDRFSAAQTHSMLADALSWFGLFLQEPVIQTLNHVLRKTGHFVGYATLSLLFWRAWRRTLHNHPGESLLAFRLRCAALALLGTLITASLDEWHQSFIPSRTGTPVDVALDMTGAIVAHLILFAILWFMGRPRRRTPEAYA